VLIRPDRIVGGAAPAYAADAMVRDFLRTIGAPIDAAVSTRPAGPRKVRGESDAMTEIGSAIDTVESNVRSDSVDYLEQETR